MTWDEHQQRPNEVRVVAHEQRSDGPEDPDSSCGAVEDLAMCVILGASNLPTRTSKCVGDVLITNVLSVYVHLK